MNIRNTLSIAALRLKHPLEAKLRGAALEIQRMIEQGSDRDRNLEELSAYKDYLTSVADLQRLSGKEPDLIEERTARLAREAVLERISDQKFLEILLKEDMPFVHGVLRKGTAQQEAGEKTGGFNYWEGRGVLPREGSH